MVNLALDTKYEAETTSHYTMHGDGEFMKGMRYIHYI
jgi:hypothetical protein